MTRYAWLALLPALALAAAERPSPRDGWRFAFGDFVIAAWNPPAATDAEYRAYREAGFNLVMSPRYELPDRALTLAAAHGLRLMVDTYTPHDKPWGGRAGQYTAHPSHHPATRPELQWLHERYGRHPALAGYLLGDDFGAIPAELVETTAWLRQNAPHLFPWICQNVMSAESLAKAGNPIQDPQIYPTLYRKDTSAAEQAFEYCRQLEQHRQGCRRHDLIPWPMFNVCGVDSDSLLRFQVYAALAYGAQGLWYFTYRDGLVDGHGYATEAQVRAHLRPTWADARDANRRLAAWGPLLLGTRCVGLFGARDMPARAEEPSAGKLVEQMSDHLLVGVLRSPAADAVALAMVVDTRVDKARGVLPERRVELRFAPAAAKVQRAEGGALHDLPAGPVSFTLPAGGGQLLRLEGRELAALCGALADRPARATRGQAAPDGLFLALPCDEGLGDRALDASPARNHLWLRGVTWVPGRHGTALHFDGRRSEGLVAEACLPTTDALSAAVWVRPTWSDQPYQPVLLIGPGGVDRFEFGFGPDHLYPVIADGQRHSVGALYVAAMRRLIAPGTWGHVAVCAGPQGATTYVNGRAVAQTRFVGRFDFAAKDISVGVRGGERFEGDLDELKLWNRCLTAPEVARLQSDR